MTDQPQNIIKAGDEITFLALEWIEEAWEFDFPSMLLEPVIKWFESGMHCDDLIEEVVIDACVFERVVGEKFPEFRGRLSYLKRIPAQLQAGKKFPVKGYKARKEVRRFFMNNQNELEAELVSAEEWGD